jgi:hypothetical protein
VRYSRSEVSNKLLEAARQRGLTILY